MTGFLRGYLWQDLRGEIEAEFATLAGGLQHIPLLPTPGVREPWVGAAFWRFQEELPERQKVEQLLGRPLKEPHIAQSATQRLAKDVVRMRQLRGERIAGGLCVYCTEYATDRRRTCVRHAFSEREKSRRARERRRNCQISKHNQRP